jgi:hypothetical protein
VDWPRELVKRVVRRRREEEEGALGQMRGGEHTQRGAGERGVD